MPGDQFCLLWLGGTDQVRITDYCVILDCHFDEVTNWKHSVPVVNDVRNDKSGLGLTVESCQDSWVRLLVLGIVLQRQQIVEGSAFFCTWIEGDWEVLVTHGDGSGIWGWNDDVIPSDNNNGSVYDFNSNSIMCVNSGSSDFNGLDCDLWNFTDRLGLFKGFLLGKNSVDGILDVFR